MLWHVKWWDKTIHKMRCGSHRHILSLLILCSCSRHYRQHEAEHGTCSSARLQPLIWPVLTAQHPAAPLAIREHQHWQLCLFTESTCGRRERLWRQSWECYTACNITAWPFSWWASGLGGISRSADYESPWWNPCNLCGFHGQSCFLVFNNVCSDFYPIVFPFAIPLPKIHFNTRSKHGRQHIWLFISDSQLKPRKLQPKWFVHCSHSHMQAIDHAGVRFASYYERVCIIQCNANLLFRLYYRMNGTNGNVQIPVNILPPICRFIRCYVCYVYDVCYVIVTLYWVPF